MQSVAATVRRRGNLATTAELLADGHSEIGIRMAWRSGSVIRVRQGWYASPDVHQDVIEAVRVGGALTCVSALDLAGFWVPRSSDLHVEVRSTAARLRARTDHRTRLTSLPERRARIHWSPSARSRLMTDPLTSIRHAIECLETELAVAAADSVLREHPEFAADWRAVVAGSSSERRHELAMADGVCESGTETLVWLRLSRLGISVRRQVPIPLVGRVDFVVGDRLVIEVDGAAYHTDPQRFEDDRTRDAALTAQDYRVLRFSYRQVMNHFDEVLAAILAVIARGEHRR
jgi:very-short-patch-repair endonuclease